MNDRLPDQPEKESLGTRLKRGWAEKTHMGLRGVWWGILDQWEHNRRFRIGLIAIASSVVLLSAGLFIGLPLWQQHNAVKIARQWLEAGRLDNAGPALATALSKAPKDPETWMLASNFAERTGNSGQALYYAREAARVGNNREDLVLDWAAKALRAQARPEVLTALSTLPPELREKNPQAHRIEAELARQETHFAEACRHFRAAIALEGSSFRSEIPLGETLLLANDRQMNEEGLVLLEKWAQNPDTGVLALGPLLTHALRTNNKALLSKWTPVLRAHPRCTLGDMPLLLQAFAAYDKDALEAQIGSLSKDAASNSGAAAQIIAWLNQTGQHQRSLAFAGTLPRAILENPPAAVVYAESLRATRAWEPLLTHLGAKPWPADTEFLRQSYALVANRALGREKKATEAWENLLALARLNPVHALFGADSLYLWGLDTQAVELLWTVAEDRSVGYQAAGTLARHYQLKRDAEGQYRVFRVLHNMRTDDPDITNNYLYFAALVGREEAQYLRLARENHERNPGNPSYRATYAFILAIQNRPTEAEALLSAAPRDQDEFPAFQFTRGVILAKQGRKQEARALLSTSQSPNVTRQEETLVESLLK